MMGFSDLVRLKLRELEKPLFDPSFSGSHFLDSKKTCEGYCLYDGKLINRKGEIVKKWQYAYLGLILPNGNYLAQEHYESQKWGLFTWDDQVIWQSSIPIHHDLIVTPQNTILTLTKEMHPYKGRNVDFCTIIELDMQGQEIFRWSSWENLKAIQKHHRALELDFPRFPFWPETAKRKDKTIWGGNYDYYRLNSIQVLPETALGKKDKRFQGGNWLISFRHGSMLFILDKDSRQIVWKCIAGDVKNGLEGQHGATMLENGNILIFDNGRYRGWSRVIEIDPVDYKICWEYRAKDFYTLSQGYVQRLSNGNTLITESEKGHAFEISPNGEKVWEYYHPESQNENNSQHPESFGQRQWIYRMVHYDQKKLSRF